MFVTLQPLSERKLSADLVVARLAPFLVELSRAKLDEKFPF